MADSAKPKVIPLLLYKDCIKIKDQKGDIQLSNVKEVKEFKELMILVLCSNHKRSKKCLLTTLKFKTINGYVNVLCKIKNIVSIEESGIAMNDRFRLPGGKGSMPREDSKSHKMGGPATDTIQEGKKRPNLESTTLFEQNFLNQPASLSRINEDSDYYSSFNSAVDYCSIFSENQYESNQRRYSEVPYLNERREILRDSRGNTVLILRPRGIRSKGNRT
nr:conserved hypothetical protein [Hymenolepis microstoma]